MSYTRQDDFQGQSTTISKIGPFSPGLLTKAPRQFDRILLYRRGYNDFFLSTLVLKFSYLERIRKLKIPNVFSQRQEIRQNMI